MATLTIKYTEPKAEADRKVLPIASMFEPQGSYVDSEPYEGTVYDMNSEGWGEWEGLADYMSKVSHHPGIMLAFRAAVRDGEFEVTEDDPIKVEYYKELGNALSAHGFEVSEKSTKA